jgi:hypothetical protein
MAVALFGGNDLILLDDVEVDGRIGEFHSFQAQPTQFAIEAGAMAADHIMEQPDTLEIAFVMSNLDEQGSSYGNRAATLVDALRSRLKKRDLWQVVTRHRLYPSMAVTAVRIEHTSPLAGGVRGRISFQEVNRDRLTRVKLPVSRVPRAKTAASQTDQGRVEPKTPTDAEKNRSVLKQLKG